MIKNILKYLNHNLISVKNKGFFHLFTASVFIKIVGFGSQFFVAWWLTVEQIGEIKIIQSYFSLLTVIVLFGFNSSMLKLCSEKKPLEQIVGHYKKGKIYITIVFLALLPIIIVISKLGLISPNPRIQFYFIIALIGLYPAAMNEYDNVYLQARKQIKLMSLRQILVRSTSLLLIVILTYLFGFDGYIAAYIISFFIAYIVFIFLIRKLNANIIADSGNYPFKEHWNFSKFAVLALVLGQLGAYADVYLMNFFVENKELIGIYSFALLLMLIPTIFSSVVQTIIVPYISAKSQDIIEIKNTYKKYQKINIVSSLIITITSLIFVPIIVNFIFGAKYADSIQFFNILMFAWFLNSISQLKGLILFGIGLINYNVYSSILITFTKFLICIVLLKTFGIVSLAYGILISNILGIFIISWFFNKGLKKHELSLNIVNNSI